MSISIATSGLFETRCRVGGAPPFNPVATEPVKPTVRVNKVEMESKKLKESFINIELVDID